MRVLYIAGMGRSGSTLLARVLGQLDEVVSVGELHHLWKTGALASSAEELCGCGLAFQRCTFWNAVLDEVFSDRPSTDDMLHLRRRVDRIRYIPWMLAKSPPERYASDSFAYRDILARLYRAIVRVGGGPLVVDAGKDPSPLFLLSTLPEFDVSIVHLVRDPRGVGYSWSRRVRRPEFAGDEVYLNTHGPVDVAVRWTYSNVLVELSRYRRADYLRVRYEDIVAQPRVWLERIAAFAGLERPDVSFVSGAVIELARENHIVAGNPMRFQQGKVRLQLDDAWRDEMAMRRRTVVSALTWPLRRRYGYQGGR